MNGTSLRPLHLLALLGLGLSGCVVGPVDPGGAAPDDDDDDSPRVVAPPPDAEVATFAASMQGAAVAPDPILVRTELTGAFQTLYWETGSSAPLCRQRLSFRAEAHFGPQAMSLCGACAGLLAIQEVVAGPDAEQEDACVDLPERHDLSFLLTADDGGVGGDFRTLALVSLDVLAELEFVLGDAGIAPRELVQTYADAGLEATYVAMVQPEGWLGTAAALGEIARPFGESGWLPMFVVYRDSARQGNAQHLEGDTYMTSLWQVALRDFPEDEGAPPGPDSGGPPPN